MALCAFSMGGLCRGSASAFSSSWKEKRGLGGGSLSSVSSSSSEPAGDIGQQSFSRHVTQTPSARHGPPSLRALSGPGRAALRDSETMLDSLPQDLLAAILRKAHAHYHLEPKTLKVLPPPLARTCRSCRNAVKNPSNALIRAKALRLSHQKKGGWPEMLKRIASTKPGALVLENCNVRAEELLDANLPTLELLVLRRCHSLAAAWDSIASLTCGALICSGLVDSSYSHSSLPKPMHELPSCVLALKMLSLVDCALSWAKLQQILPHMADLQVLMLGGSILRDDDYSTDSASSNTNATPASPMCPKLKIIEVTFLPVGVRGELNRLFPHATRLNFCSSKVTLKKSIIALERIANGILETQGAAAARFCTFTAANCRFAGRSGTPLHIMAIEGDTDAVKYLLSLGSSAAIKDERGWTPLHRAVWWGHADVCKLLLASPDCDPHAVNHAMESSLYIAALRGKRECLAVLLDYFTRNSEQLHRDNEPSGYTPLHAAVIGRSAQCLELLLNHKNTTLRDINSRNKFMQTPLHIAARVGSKNAVAALLARGANPKALDERGHTPMQIAQKVGHMELIEFFLQYTHNRYHSAEQASVITKGNLHLSFCYVSAAASKLDPDAPTFIPSGIQ